MKRPPIIYGGGQYKKEGHREYCQLFENLRTHVDIMCPQPLSMAHRVHTWAREDGFYVRTKKIEGGLRVFRLMVIVANKKTLYIVLKNGNFLGLQYLEPNENVTWGPFFNTPLNQRNDWGKYIQHTVKRLKKGSFEVKTRILANPNNAYESGTAYTIRRIL